jgi:hypothetical protein
MLHGEELYQALSDPALKVVGWGVVEGNLMKPVSYRRAKGLRG